LYAPQSEKVKRKAANQQPLPSAPGNANRAARVALQPQQFFLTDAIPTCWYFVIAKLLSRPHEYQPGTITRIHHRVAAAFSWLRFGRCITVVQADKKTIRRIDSLARQGVGTERGAARGTAPKDKRDGCSAKPSGGYHTIDHRFSRYSEAA
jgi:hypothetical protein